MAITYSTLCHNDKKVHTNNKVAETLIKPCFKAHRIVESLKQRLNCLTTHEMLNLDTVNMTETFLFI